MTNAETEEQPDWRAELHDMEENLHLEKRELDKRINTLAQARQVVAGFEDCQDCRVKVSIQYDPVPEIQVYVVIPTLKNVSTSLVENGLRVDSATSTLSWDEETGNYTLTFSVTP